MRLWSLHPRHLDARGLVPLWREGLLARAVLHGETRGYRHHPQLQRFLARRDPVAALDCYLSRVIDEARARGYQFDASKICYHRCRHGRAMGFLQVETIDEDLGRSGSGLAERPGFQRLVASVCTGSVGAVFCIEASRLARNGRDWHHLIDLCALVGTLVIDPDGVYEPRLIKHRLLLGLEGTMSEYELSLLRQRGLAARDSKARRGAT